MLRLSLKRPRTIKLSKTSAAAKTNAPPQPLPKNHPSVCLFDSPTTKHAFYGFYHPKTESESGVPYDLTKPIPNHNIKANLTANQRLQYELNSRGKDLKDALPLGPNKTYQGPETLKDAQMWWNTDHKMAGRHLSQILKMSEFTFRQDNATKRFDFESSRKMWVPRRHESGDSESLVPESPPKSDDWRKY